MIDYERNRVVDCERNRVFGYERKGLLIRKGIRILDVKYCFS